MKTIKDKQILVGADFAGYPLKEAVVKHCRRRAGLLQILALRLILTRMILT